MDSVRSLIDCNFGGVGIVNPVCEFGVAEMDSGDRMRQVVLAKLVILRGWKILRFHEGK